MTRSRLLRRVAALAALLAISLQAFWPLLVQAQPKSVSAEAICSSGGEHGADGHFRHCALCSGADRFQALVPEAPGLAVVPAAAIETSVARHAAFLPVSRSPANPRAPPALS